MSALALGIDLGTTAVKSVVLDEGSEIASFGYKPVRLISGPGGLVEHDVEELWQATRGAVRDALCGRRLGRTVRAIGLSSQGGTLILLDKAGSPIGNAISWMDTRPAQLGAALLRGRDEAFFYEKTGWSLRLGCLPLAQLIRLRAVGGASVPNVGGASVPRVRFVDSYVVERLTGEAVTNPSDAAITMLYNVRARRWDDELLALGGASRRRLPRVAASGTAVGGISKQAAEELGVCPDAMVFAGGHDQYCAAFGAGCRKAGDTIVSCGTAWVLLTLTTEPRFPCAGLAPAEAVAGGLWGLLGSCSSVGAATDWFRRFIAPRGREVQFSTLASAASEVEPSPDAPVAVLPVGGTGGRLIGFGLHHTFKHLARAVLESSALSARVLLERMSVAGAFPALLKAVGGAVSSRLWMQILADAAGLPLEIAGFQDAAAFGAARLAGEAAGIIPHDAPWPRPAATIEPRAAHRETYDTLYERFKDATR